MNAAIKLIAFVGQSAARVLDIIVQRDVSAGDLVAARRILIGIRADLDEADQRLRQEIDRRVQRPNPLVPVHASITDREVDDYERRLHASTACIVPETIHDPAEPFRGVESPARPHPLMPRFRPTHTFSPSLRKLLPLSPVLSSPGRKAV